jgi:hypothetical protein
MTAQRTATMQLHKSGETSMLRVAVPKDTTARELALLNEAIIEKVIKPQTGCPCLSGRISVLLENDFQQAIQVNLAVKEQTQQG